ncbi:conserved Plasmodium protein, unknown function [Plasmodium knowlesi strain H]|uniref:CID domain-containing protein n=3 Tax=Plasmodium knowlesi TaxID=5850 RepID=A0A5K1VBS5_PLAKH|nr:conserved Plasmodium protein, unknown function [Plasmodium knowlesi strain H]OTN66653.1 Uncharacterized protein PKNOH_S08503700 [Plasmodium knowlesi]CAA9986694.1 conserved Plasmodium protein, unknown function [Plasmodium knowlesi strain H]SBO23507.1 conserved Plasmodium protein, unknown function [Plasmodium knowlesi strain H]SBO24996.1 conserved Plasmodium protein, unknown function [Plasmodium knowlesi strain H]VVS76168.1 conserved Plasmodium protein, unknown function [Plasmodium knowlesi s|eukprot:XP_002257879.1 hypothetical protein, conserved in Plasmodium species [Plasmodium knowlesi strain H]
MSPRTRTHNGNWSKSANDDRAIRGVRRKYGESDRSMSGGGGRRSSSGYTYSRSGSRRSRSRSSGRSRSRSSGRSRTRNSGRSRSRNICRSRSRSRSRAGGRGEEEPRRERGNWGESKKFWQSQNNPIGGRSREGNYNPPKESNPYGAWKKNTYEEGRSTGLYSYTRNYGGDSTNMEDETNGIASGEMNQMNAEDERHLQDLLKQCEESRKDSREVMNEWVLKKCSTSNVSQSISVQFYQRILKCAFFKNKLNLICSYNELLKCLRRNGRTKELEDFKVYIHSIIQDGYTCAYYKDHGAINILLQMVHGWKETFVTNFNENKLLLSVFHNDNSNGNTGSSWGEGRSHIDTYHKGMPDQSTNNPNGGMGGAPYCEQGYMDNHTQRYATDFERGRYGDMGYYNGRKIPPPPTTNILPPPPPPPPPPLLPSSDFPRCNKQFDRYKKNDFFPEEGRKNYFNNPWGGENNRSKNPESISVGFLATLLKFISKKGKKMQVPLVPYTPIDISYTYQTPPSTNTSQQLNEKINDFYEELGNIMKDEGGVSDESSDVSESSERMKAYENYKTLKNLGKKEKVERNYTSDTNTTFSSVELFDNSMIELLNDSDEKLRKNKKSKNVNFSQIAIENAQNWNEEGNAVTSNFDFYSAGMPDPGENDVFEKYRRSKAYVYHEAIAQKFHEFKGKDPRSA